MLTPSVLLWVYYIRCQVVDLCAARFAGSVISALDKRCLVTAGKGSVPSSNNVWTAFHLLRQVGKAGRSRLLWAQSEPQQQKDNSIS